MDIVGLPLVPPLRAAGSSTRQAQQPHAVERIGRVESPGARARVAGTFERVVQGELLERERAQYQSTRAFLIERSMEGAQPAERQSASPYQTRPAIARYLNHSQPESVPELTRGRSVNLVV